ncbi:iron ABC transporter substrate-binding protein [Rhodovulum sulfidophilum]|uniref:Siderophore ABC transporter substrate-binding protein n=1 Tax=Rhodovulum visakhapatnamense TaxID=364297 RepID=A0ABS1REI2_9RHOB|nr:siderophore ABC transporter substrate-binding protein [Rhodovulum visakhapatnamense]MBL3570476.1 siderophore ABC transporter substrate-binding protein [Rhodovulum visakhapatnamense]MBL3578043.1 siderophore ABC transporter substrate-binding protein [Rhodovulum visakhapatnamense]OLS44553.1 iron ABC transporter substrate-binding protein [Rhodovulum sulfidophilum]
MLSRSLASLALALCLGLPAAARTVTVETATGPAELTADPARVAVMDIAALDTLDALGVDVAGVPEPHYLPYLDATASRATRIGTLFEPDFEALAILDPDLIVVGSRSSGQAAALARIAPTIDMTVTGQDMLAETRARLQAYGRLFGRETEAAALEAALDARIAAARAAVAGKGDALIVLTNGGKISAYGRDSRFGWLHTALGLPEAHPDLGAATHGEAISFEFVAETDPDWILAIDRGAAIGASGEAAAATLDNVLVRGTEAARAGQIVYLDSGPLYIAGGGVQSMMHTLDEIVAAFSADRP